MNEINFVIEKEFDEKIYTNQPDICRECGGIHCCRHSPCAYSPYDFHVFRQPYSKAERLKFLIYRLKKGDISIDHMMCRDKINGAYEITPELNRELMRSMILHSDLQLNVNREKLMNMDGLLFLRARSSDKGIVDAIHLNWIEDTPCSLWDPKKGCKYPYEKRPKGGRMVVPKRDMPCVPMYNEHNAVQEWSRYQDILYDLFQYFFKK